MPYFPFFADISGRRCLIVGGGRIALHKIKKLLPFSPEIHVVASVISREITDIPGVAAVQREFRDSDLEGVCFVIAATDRREVNAHVAELCRSSGIPVNAVDDPENCTFFFPALAQRGDMTVGISTAGKSPLIAAELRRQAEKLLTPEMAEICSLMGFIRPYVRRKFPEEGQRAKAMAAALEFCTTGDLPDEEALLAFIDGMEVTV